MRYFYHMKYIWLGCIVLMVSCKEPDKESSSLWDAPEYTVTENDISSEIGSNQDFIKIVDYEGLAPLLASKNDTTYVVNFWATWCAPCVKELPYFEKINADYKDQKVKVVLVSLDFPDKLEKQVIPYVKKHLKSEVWLLDDADANGWIPKVDNTWTGAIPATIIYNKNNRMFYEQSFNYDQLKTAVTTILNK